MAEKTTKKICLITPGHISSNPRLVKEVSALESAGYIVHIVFVQNLEYLIEHDHLILKAHPSWTFDVLNLTATDLKTQIYKLSHTIKQKLIQRFRNYRLTERFGQTAINRHYTWQKQMAVEADADLYIAHNLGALPVAVISAKKNSARCGFDAEDFHRNESSDDPKDLDVKLKAFIEDKYIPEVNYLTAASPMIAEAYKALYPKLNPIVINNVFEIKQQPPLNLNNDADLDLFWFSQTIGKNRGLEDVISAMNELNNDSIKLHLLGNLSDEDRSYFDGSAKFKINYYAPIPSDKLFNLAAQFDVGLALEPGFCLNNKIALSNKLFTYLVSGLAIIASGTPAQQAFLIQNPDIGICYEIGNISQIKMLILQFLKDKNLLNTCKQNAYYLGQNKYNWENESYYFLSIISSQVNYQ